jgi:H+/Cl- antiporter ClcA
MKTFLPDSRTILPKISAVKTFAFQILPYWFAASLSALVAVLFAKAYGWSETFMFSWAAPHPTYAFIIIPLAMLASMSLVMFGAPYANGSGIPQIIAGLEIASESNAFVRKLLNFRIIVVKFVGACICIAGGGVIGREGPMLQISASIFQLVERYWPKFRTKFDPQSMILAGGAAGLASAFNTPIGGVIFAVEELAKVHISSIRTTVFHAVIIAGLLAQGLMGNYLYLSRISLQQYSLMSTFFLAFAAAGIGMIGALFGVFLTKSNELRHGLSTQNKFIMTAVCGLIVATIFYFTQIDALGSGRGLITHLLEHPHEEVGPALGFSRILTNYFTYSGGVVGGIFAPSLSSGAALGAWLSQYVPTANPEVWILGGMVAFLTGVTRTPFTSLVLVLEMTDSHGIILDLMLAAMLAQGAARLIDPVSFYEHMAHRIVAGYKTQMGIDGSAPHSGATK